MLIGCMYRIKKPRVQLIFHLSERVYSNNISVLTWSSERIDRSQITHGSSLRSFEFSVFLHIWFEKKTQGRGRGGGTILQYSLKLILLLWGRVRTIKIIIKMTLKSWRVLKFSHQLVPALVCRCSSPGFKVPLLHSLFNFSNLSEAALSKFSAPGLGKIDRNLTIRRCLKQFSMWYENHPVPNCRPKYKLNMIQWKPSR